MGSKPAGSIDVPSRLQGETLERYLRWSSATGIANNLVSAVTVLLLLPLIVARVGMEKYGAWAILSIFVGVASMADLGLSKALVFLLPRQQNPVEARAVVGAASFMSLFVVIVFAAAGTGVVLAGFDLLPADRSIGPELGRSITVAGFTIACLVVSTSFLRAVLESTYRLPIVNIGFLLLTVLQYVALLAFSLVVDSVEALLLGSVTAYAAIWVMHMIAVLRVVPLDHLLPRPVGLRKLFSVSVGFLAAGTLTAAIDPIGRYALLSIAGDSVDFGKYDIAMRIALMAGGLLTALAAPLFAVFSRLGNENIREIASIARKTVLRSGILYVVGVICFAAIGKPVLELWLGVDIREIYCVALILIGGYGLSGVFEPFSRAVWALGYIRTVAWLRLAQIGVVVGLIVMTASLEPIIRIALACSVSHAAFALCNFAIFGRAARNGALAS